MCHVRTHAPYAIASFIRLSDRYKRVATEWRSMDGFTDLLDCITDGRGLLFLSVCNKAVMPRWLYASYWWRQGVVLRTRISTLGNACTDTVCIPNPWPIRIVIEFARCVP